VFGVYRGALHRVHSRCLGRRMTEGQTHRDLAKKGDGEKDSWDVINNAAWMERLDSSLGGRTGGFPSVLVLKFLARLFFLTI
jgi:hypothetical protein